MAETKPGENSMADLRRFFATPERPVAMDEFVDFWKSLTDAEKQEFRTAKLV
jgi:hypothetical protein